MSAGSERRVLVIANETVAGWSLLNALRDRAETALYESAWQTRRAVGRELHGTLS